MITSVTPTSSRRPWRACLIQVDGGLAFGATPRARHDRAAPRSQARPEGRQTVREPSHRTPRTLRLGPSIQAPVSFRRLLYRLQLLISRASSAKNCQQPFADSLICHLSVAFGGVNPYERVTHRRGRK